MLTANEANRLCDKTEQEKACLEENSPSEEELQFLNEILSSIKEEASNKALDWGRSYTRFKDKQMLPKICSYLKELGVRRIH